MVATDNAVFLSSSQMKTLSFQVFLMLMVAVPVEFQVTWEFWTKLQLFTGYKRTLKTLEVCSNAGNNPAVTVELNRKLFQLQNPASSYIYITYNDHD